MLNVTFTKKVTAQVNLSAEDWQLYTSSMDCEAAAQGLNRGIEDAIGTSSTVNEAYKKFCKVANAFRAFGAADSEPQYVAEDILTKAFGEQ